METELSQDSKQKMNVMVSFGLEFYRVLMGCMLMVFVPQKCGDHICSINENINRDDTLSRITIAFNSITLFAFLILYAIEVKRESKLITYLEVNKFKALDNESVGEALTQLDIFEKLSIFIYDIY